MFIDPLAQYNFDVPLGWAYNLRRSHLITVVFTRADRVEERLIVRAVPTHASDVSDDEWYARAEQRAFPPEMHPVERLHCGHSVALFAARDESAPERERLQCLVVRGVRMDAVVQHVQPPGDIRNGLSDVLARFERTYSFPADMVSPRLSRPEAVYALLQAAQEASHRQDWHTVSAQASSALALARDTYLASVVGGALLPEVPAVMAVIDALILQGHAEASLLRLREAEFLVERARHTTAKLDLLSAQRRAETLSGLDERLLIMQKLQNTIMETMGHHDASDQAPLPMRRATAMLGHAAVAFERDDVNTALDATERALEDMLLLQVVALEAPAAFANQATGDVREKLLTLAAGAQSPRAQATVAKRIVNRFLLAEIAGTLRTLATMRHAAGAHERALEANALLVQISHALDLPEQTPFGEIEPMAGHRSFLAAATLELLQHRIATVEQGDPEEVSWQLDKVEMMLEELKEGGALRAKHRLIQAALASSIRGALQTGSAAEAQMHQAIAAHLSQTTLKTLADWALGPPSMLPARPCGPVTLPASVLPGGPSAIIQWGLQEKADSDAARFWQATGAEAHGASLAEAEQLRARWLQELDWRNGFAIAALRALDPTVPLDGSGRLLGIEYARACLVQPPVLSDYAIAQSVATGASGFGERAPVPEYSPFGDAVIREVLRALDLLIAAQESQPARLRRVRAEVEGALHPDFDTVRTVVQHWPPGRLFQQSIRSEGIGSALSMLLRAESEQAEHDGDVRKLEQLHSPMIRIAARYGCTSDFLLAVHRAAAVTDRIRPNASVLTILEHVRLAAVWLGDASLEAVVQHAIALMLRAGARKAPGLLDAIAAFQRAITLRDQIGEPTAAAGALIDLSAVLIAYRGMLNMLEEGEHWPDFAERYLLEAIARLSAVEPDVVTLHHLGEAFQNRARLHLSLGDKTRAAQDAARSLDFAQAIDFADLDRRARETLALAADCPESYESKRKSADQLVDEVRQEVGLKLGASKSSTSKIGLFSTILDTLFEAAGQSIDEARAAELLITELENARGYTYNRWVGAAPVMHLRMCMHELAQDRTQPVFVVYLVTRSRLGMIVIDRDQPARLVPIEMTNEQLQAVVQAHLRGLRKQGRMRGKLPWRSFQQEFMQNGMPLVAPLQPYVAAGRTICVIPHRALHGAALHTLPAWPGGEAIGLCTPVFTNPSLANWLVARRNAVRPASKAFVGVAGPQAELAEFTEVRPVVELLSRAGLEVIQPLPSEVDLHSFVPQHGGWKVLHLSSHGIFEPERQEMGLLLAHEGKLPPPPNRPIDAEVSKHLAGPNDLRRVCPEARLTFLASCLSSRNDEYPGDDLMGMTRAWFASGTADLVAGAWTVVSSITGTFADAFYRALLEERPVAEAVFEARRAVAHIHPDPFFWGAFVHQGANAKPCAHEMNPH